jgi:hypothetical protein
MTTVGTLRNTVHTYVLQLGNFTVVLRMQAYGVVNSVRIWKLGLGGQISTRGAGKSSKFRITL